MSKRPKPEAFQDQLRQAIDADERSRYRICKLAGFSESTMSRFMGRRGSMSLPSVDKLVEVLGLELRPRTKRTAARKRRR